MAYLGSIVGLSGSGKSTAIRNVSAELDEHGLSVVDFHDRKTGEISQSIDSLIKEQGDGLVPEARFYMFLAARRQIIESYIAPALVQHDVVLTERYFPCTIAYQAYGEGLDRDMVAQESIQAAHGAIPDRVFFLGITAEEALARMVSRGEDPKIFDSSGLAFHERVRQGYLEQAAGNDTYTVIDGLLPPMQVASMIGNHILKDISSASQI